MNLVVQREVLTEKSTIGRLFIDSEFFCYCLEDVVRPFKIPGKTAIPADRYRVVITPSVRFNKRLPLLEGVDGFTGIRIHSGNVAEDTEGCLILGMTKTDDFVGQSRVAMEKFMPKLEAALQDGGECWITILNP